MAADPSSSRNQISSQSKRQHACWKRVVSYIPFVLLFTSNVRKTGGKTKTSRKRLSSGSVALFTAPCAVSTQQLSFLRRRGVAARFWGQISFSSCVRAPFFRSPAPAHLIRHFSALLFFLRSGGLHFSSRLCG